MSGRLTETDLRNHRIAVWIGGPGAVILLLVGWGLVAGLVPLPAPRASASSVAHLYRHNGTRITVGIVLTMFGGTCMTMWVVVLSLYMRRIEGRWGVWSLSQLLLGALLPFEFYIPGTILLEPAFRTNLPPSTILMLNDLGTIFFVQPGYPLMLEAIVLGVAVLQDRNATPIFPRWTAAVDFGFALSFLPLEFVTLFKTGPMAWNGLFGWWIPLIAWSIWIIIETAVVLKAINRDEQALEDVTGEDGEALDLRTQMDLLRAEMDELQSRTTTLLTEQ